MYISICTIELLQAKLKNLIRKPYFDVILSVTPISLGVQISKFHDVLESQLYLWYRSGDFPSNEILTSPRTLVIEQYAVAREHAVRFTIIYRYPKTVQLRAS